MARKRKTHKDKAIAILLAVFLGFWTWIYTYKDDAWKFWLSIGITVTISWVFLFLPNLVIHIWAIIDTIVKDQKWYKDY
tara:strand:+ start:288 stop:524 length:237 start_codon:yes stop_codon:yes gene_type:complete